MDRMLHNEPGHPSSGKDKVYAALIAWGAALVHAGVPAHEPSKLEELLPQATRLAHHDATVLRTLPLLVARHAEELSVDLLQRAATREQQEAEIGMLLALTGSLIGNEKLQRSAEVFAHARKSTPELFFQTSGSDREYRLAQLRTPQVVREWGFLMNMPEDVFRTLLDKYRG